MHTPVNKRKVRQEHTLSEFYGVYIVSQLSCLKEGERATLTFSFAGSQLVQIPVCVCVCVCVKMRSVNPKHTRMCEIQRRPVNIM